MFTLSQTNNYMQQDNYTTVGLCYCCHWHLKQIFHVYSRKALLRFICNPHQPYKRSCTLMYPVSPAFKYMSKIQIISRQTLRPYNNRLPDYCALTREVLCFLISFMRQSKVLQHVINLLHGLLAITSLQQRVEENMLLYCQAE